MLLSVSNTNGLAWAINSVTEAPLLAGSLAQQIFIRLGAAQYAASRKYRRWSMVVLWHHSQHSSQCCGSTFSLIPSDDLFKIQSKFWNRPLLKLSKFKDFGGWLSLSLELPPATGTTCVRSHKRTEKGRNLSYKLHGWYQWISGFCKIFTKPTMVYP